MTRPLVARIDAAALAHNLALARRLAGTARVLAVIKANAYGHGLVRAAKALAAADGFAVLGLEEAAMLRSAGFSHPVVLLEGFFDADELPEIARRRLIPVLHREDQIETLARSRLPHKIDVFVKLDSGMHRLGMAPATWRKVVARLATLPQVGQLTLMSHFACADMVEVGVTDQLATFHAAAQGLHQPVSLANSAALMRYPETTADWVRPGIMLYGASPFAGASGESLGLLPAMSLDSRLIAVQPVRRGDAVGYGGEFVAPRATRVGIVACGYADGYPRHAPTGTPVAVDGRRTRLVGRVSMDMLQVDLEDLPDAHVGSAVNLWGTAVGVDEVAAAAGTIGYELLTAVTARVPVEDA